MTTWSDDIQTALERSRSPYSALDVIRWLRSGEASMGVSGRMSASLWWAGPDGAEVSHVAGVYTNEDTCWLLDWADRECRARGISMLSVNGRNGWRRWMRKRGIKHGS